MERSTWRKSTGTLSRSSEPRPDPGQIVPALDRVGAGGTEFRLVSHCDATERRRLLRQLDAIWFSCRIHGRIDLKNRYRTAYQVCVWRIAQPGTTAVYPIPLRERLPVISIPLRPQDRDVLLSLQAVLDQCYRNGGYDDIDYRGEPDPPLHADDATWADSLLREQGRR